MHTLVWGVQALASVKCFESISIGNEEINKVEFCFILLMS